MLTNKKTIPWNEFFKRDVPNYITYKVIPDLMVENNQNEVVARAMSTLYKTPLDRLELDIKGMKITYYAKRKVFFDILLIPGNANFYFTIPYDSQELFLTKIKSIWSKSAVVKASKEELHKLNYFEDSNSMVAKLISKTFNFKSLSTDKGDLYPLTNMLGLINNLNEELEESVRLNFSINPLKRRNWVSKANDEYNSYKKR